MKKKIKLPRNFLAVSAHFRNSAGSMKNMKYELSKYTCRSNFYNCEYCDDVEDLEDGLEVEELCFFCKQ